MHPIPGTAETRQAIQNEIQSGADDVVLDPIPEWLKQPQFSSVLKVPDLNVWEWITNTKHTTAGDYPPDTYRFGLPAPSASGRCSVKRMLEFGYIGVYAKRGVVL